MVGGNVLVISGNGRHPSSRKPPPKSGRCSWKTISSILSKCHSIALDWGLVLESGVFVRGFHWVYIDRESDDKKGKALIRRWRSRMLLR